MRFALDLADADIEWLERHMALRAGLVASGTCCAGTEDRIFGMVLGGAKGAGWGKKRRAKR